MFRHLLRPDRRPRLIAATASVVAIALVAGLLAWHGATPAAAPVEGPSGAPLANASGSPSSQPDPSAAAAANAVFTRLTGASPAPAVRLTVRGPAASGPVVPLAAAFRLETTDGTPASALIAGLTVSPPFAFSATPETGDRSVVVRPDRPLAAGTLYRFSLAAADGGLIDTWAFQAAQPLRIVGTLPGADEAGVPIDTGIEITFDQDGFVDAASHVTISPTTPGRFEEHGRTLAFVPDRPLTKATLYTVTVTRGIAVAATGEKTEADTRFQFETASATSASDNPRMWMFPGELSEATTTSPATIAIWTSGDDTTPTSLPVSVYRLPTIEAAIDAFRTIRAQPDWTVFSQAGLVDVSKLTRIVSATLPIQPFRSAFWFELPGRLPAGWYLVQQAAGTHPTQLVLQVTDLAGYLAVSDTKTLVWVNDLRTRNAVVGATAIATTANVAAGVALGRTNGDGLVSAGTPRRLLPADRATCARPCAPVVVVRAVDGRQIILPISTGQDKNEGGGDLYWWSEGDSRTWTVFHADRNRYRSGDTVNLWGLARDRATGAAPATVVIRLTGSGEDRGDGSVDSPPIVTLTRRLDAAGAFSGSISLAGLPDGDYQASLVVGTRVVRQVAISVGPLPKPAYRLDVTTGHRVYIAGDHVTATVKARFFEGTPVPGVPLRMGGFGDETLGHATTDPVGSAVWRTIAALGPDGDREGPTIATIEAMPARAEEAEITAGSRDVVVFPSTRTIAGAARFVGNRVSIGGSVHLVALDRLESALTAGASIWDLDVRGAAVRGAAVTVNFIERIPKRTQVGTEYDFVEKRAVPIYQTDIVDRPAGTVHVTTDTKGAWTASIPAAANDHEYRVVASVRDPDGHTAQATAYAQREVGALENLGGQFATLGLSTPTANPDNLFGVGQRIDLRLTDPIRHQAAGDGSRYLFFTAQRGIHGATIQASPRFVTTFPAWGPPNLSIGGVRFTGTGYDGTAWYGATFRTADRRLLVDVTSDAAAYRPGAAVTVRVRTRTADGGPVAATVVLRAVDEKLFAIGAAAAEDPLAEMYASVGSGMVGTYRSHRDPQGESGGGDTTGGGGNGRDDFRDSLLFTTITTGSDGRGSTSFRLSDDLTSWRVTAAAVTRRLQAGVGSTLVAVGLPFFVDASVAAEYLAADRPSIAVRTYGSALRAGAPVTIRVTAPGLGFDSGNLASTAFANLDVALPALTSGAQTVTITATTGAGSTLRTDRMTRTFAVVDSRLTRQRSTSVELPSSAQLAGGTGFTDVVIADAGGGRYLALLEELSAGGGARSDRALAADLAASLLKSRFGIVPTGAAATASFAPDRYQGEDGGFALVPYGSSDLELSALVAIVAPTRVDRAKLAFYLRTIRDDAAATRERRMIALAGLAGLGEPVLRDVSTALGDSQLTVREQLFLGLGAAGAGDSATARRALDAVVKAVGEQAGSVARLRVGSTAADITEATALGAALAAAVGDPLGPRFWAWVEANPAADRIEVLPAIAFVTRSLDRLAATPAKAAWTVNGVRQEAEIGRGGSIHLTLTASQLATLRVQPLRGTIGVTTSWREPIRSAALHPDPDLTISRSVEPKGPVAASDLVVVELHVRFSAQASNDCRQVTELVPSGLAPVGPGSRWAQPDGENGSDPSVVLPYDQTGSIVRFCVTPDAKTRDFTLRYVARVVTRGTYVWEPAIVQPLTDEATANLVPASSITIP